MVLGVTMEYPIDKRLDKTQKYGFTVFAIFLIALTIGAVQIGFIEYNTLVQSLITTGISFLVVGFFVKDDRPTAYSIESNKLRISKNAAYPIEKIYKIHLKSTKPDVYHLKIFATQMDKLKSPPILHGDKLAKELCSMNEGIELVNDSKDA